MLSFRNKPQCYRYTGMEGITSNHIRKCCLFTFWLAIYNRCEEYVQSVSVPRSSAVEDRRGHTRGPGTGSAAAPYQISFSRAKNSTHMWVEHNHHAHASRRRLSQCVAGKRIESIPASASLIGPELVVEAQSTSVVLLVAAEAATQHNQQYVANQCASKQTLRC